MCFSLPVTVDPVPVQVTHALLSAGASVEAVEDALFVPLSLFSEKSVAKSHLQRIFSSRTIFRQGNMEVCWHVEDYSPHRSKL